MRIIGAGMAGLLAAQMMRRHRPSVVEAQASLPNNHNALLRFRTDAVSRATGIPFRRVHVTKAWYSDRLRDIMAPQELTLREANMYSYKVAGELLSRSIINMDAGERWVAPANFILQLAEGLDITFGTPFRETDVSRNDEPTISTIPMSKLMDMVDWTEEMYPTFRWRSIFTTRGTIMVPKSDIYHTIYFPGPAYPWYRISITGFEIIAESMNRTAGMVDVLDELVAESFGLPADAKVLWHEETRQEYGKLTPVDDGLRRAFILAMTDQHRIYSLGRFATWRQILLDDVVHDVQVIEKFITERDAYARQMASVPRG